MPTLSYDQTLISRQMTLGIKLISCQGRPSWIDIIYYMLNSWSSCCMRVQHLQYCSWITCHFLLQKFTQNPSNLSRVQFLTGNQKYPTVMQAPSVFIRLLVFNQEIDFNKITLWNAHVNQNPYLAHQANSCTTEISKFNYQVRDFTRNKKVLIYPFQRVVYNLQFFFHAGQSNYINVKTI